MKQRIGIRPALGIATLALILVSVPMRAIATDPCATTGDADQETLEEALEACERGIEETGTLLREQEEEKERIYRDLILIDQEAKALLLEMETHARALRSLDSAIAEAVNAVERAEQAARNREGGIDDQEIARLERQIISLGEKRVEREEMRKQQKILAAQIQRRIEQKQELLEYRDRVEKESQELIRLRAGRAAAIKGRLFVLRGGSEISFEQAMEHARQASGATGVRPAFLIGLIKNESDMGHNIGSGTGESDMHPTRDRPVFPYITDLFGYDPETMPVSANPGFGWGGAMGPAQFIPSTWVCYGGLVNERTGTCEPTDGVIRGSRRLMVGSVGPDVRRLREFLGKNGFTVADNDDESVTETYTHGLGAAIIEFQEKYAERILSQYDRARGTGRVGPATRNAINQIAFYTGPWRYEAERDLVRRITGSKGPSNPWNPRDAMLAAALYLRNLGAVSDECGAARRYYAGDNWESRVALNYCRAVISNAREFERDAEFLNRSGA